MTTKATILRTIREHCIGCMGGMQSEVEKCTAPKCKLFEYRMGRDPRVSAKKADNARRRFHTESSEE